jgi:hypothetical protein
MRVTTGAHRARIATPFQRRAAVHGMISRQPDCLRREFGVRGFEFQKTHDVGLGFAKPVQRKARPFAAWS